MPAEREGISAYPPLQVGSTYDKEEKGQLDVRDQSLEEKEKDVWISLLLPFFFFLKKTATRAYLTNGMDVI